MLHQLLKRVFYIPFLPALMWAGLILLGSTSRGVKVPIPTPNWVESDKLVHALAYAGLGFLTLVGLYVHQRWKATRGNQLLVLFFCLLFGVSLECVQGAFVPGRMFEFPDMIANTVGLGLGWLIYSFIFT
jgi:VanZ family protein